MTKFKAIIKALIPNYFVQCYRRRRGRSENFKFNAEVTSDVKADIQEKYGHNSELLELFTTNKKHIVHKWHHYIPIYDRYFSPFRGRKIRFLEIGVDKGGSLQMWREYFGKDAIIFGIDTNPDCAKLNGLAGQVRIGSQTDEIFLESVIKEMGGIDIVLDHFGVNK